MRIVRHGFLLALLAITVLKADEGMWPFNMIPQEKIESRYGTRLSDKWLDHVQKSCLRLSLGGSGSFVSKKGLVMTNHHVGSEAIYDLSTADNNLMEKGFYAATYKDELKCPGLYVDQLVAIRDVTADVQKAMKEAPQNPESARKETLALLSKKAQQETGLQPEPVTLYQGGRYHIYLYKRYTDIRLVMAPEKNIAFFGGDNDNFEYPRYNLDVCFFRVYDNDKPLVTENYLSWNANGPTEKEVLFVAGHPGNTKRLYTAEHLLFIKEVEMPLLLSLIDGRIVCLQKFGSQSSEQARMSLQALFRLQNARKVFRALDNGLNGPRLIPEKQEYEKNLLKDVSAAPWQDLTVALNNTRPFYKEYFVLEGRGAHGFSTLYDFACTLVRAQTERAKPQEKRLKEYTDSELPALENELFSTAPIYPALEEVTLADGLERTKLLLGREHPAVQALFNEGSIKDLAVSLIQNTKLTDVAYRKELYENPEALDKSVDPLILFAKKREPFARALREKYEDTLEGVQKASYAQIADTLFERFGTSLYPDATFTLRLSFGTMKGYTEQTYTRAPKTTLAGLFKHADSYGNKGDYALPASWLEKKSLICNQTPFNFVSTHDIIGGNSGSPVINQKGEVVGLIFDGNIYSLLWNLQFDETKGRAISVHSAAILTALKDIYGAQALVDEISDFQK